MSDASNTPEPALIKAVLEPLLDDFQYWFDRSITLLKSEDITFLDYEEHQNLLERIQQAQQQVSAVRALSSVTGNQTGVDMPLMMTWHQLVQECWGVSARYRRQVSQSEPESGPETSS
ncbi:MAG: DUF2605 domain-containing protein [Cyanobacteria bacterium P01_A01_bin.105]